MDITFALDYTNQEPTGYAQVFAGAVPTQRSAYRQFATIIADLGYELPSRDPFDRLIDHNTQWKSGNEMGGASANIDVELGPGTLTSTTSWRFWNWDPSNDRDYLGCPSARCRRRRRPTNR
jgi:iron complex outermembrane receptor protein